MRSSLIVVTPLVFFVGCATTRHAEESIEEAENSATEAIAQLDDLITNGAHDPTSLYLAGEQIELETMPEPLPPELLVDTIYRFAPDLAGLPHIAQHVRARTGLQVVLTRMGPAKQGSAPSDAERAEVSTNYEGTIAGLLDAATSAAGASWRYDSARHRVELYRYDTRSWGLHALPITDDMRSDVSNAATSASAESGSGTAFGSTLTTTTSAKLDPASDLLAVVESMLSPEGSVSFSRSMSLLSVTDLPPILDQIDHFIERFNTAATRQIALRFELFAVEITAADSYGFDWNLLWQGSNASLNWFSGARPEDGTNSGSIGIINPQSPFSGTQVFVDALSSQGDVSLVASSSDLALNNTLIQRQIGNEEPFLTEVKTDLVANVGGQTSATLTQFTDGIQLRFLPLVIDDERLILQLEVNLSDLRASGDFEVGETLTLNGPRAAVRNISQRVALRSGQTLVLTGFDSMDSRSDRRGVGSSRFWGLGGGANASQVRTLLVALITPRFVG